MKIRFTLFLGSSLLLFFLSGSVFAQYPVVNGDQVKSWLQGKKKAVVIDTRFSEEYEAGHIPGAVNIPAERVHLEAKKLPSDKATPLIFYCRGTT